MNSLIAKLHPFERKVLPILKSTTDFQTIIKETKLQDIEVMRALQWLSNKGALTVNIEKSKLVHLKENGTLYKKQGLPEKRLAKTLTDKFQTITAIAKSAKLSGDEVNASIGQLKRNKAVDIQKGAKGLELKATNVTTSFLKNKSPEELLLSKSFPLNQESLSKEDQQTLKNLSKRKDFIEIKDEKTVNIKVTALGKTLSKKKINQNVTSRLTPAMLQNGSWKKHEFRAYDVEINVPKINGGRRHPYNEALNVIRNSFLEMGFQEMTGPWVETSFWGMDSMWIAQDHPMREAQDTFYLDIKGDLPNKALVNKVKAAHENGYNTGSTGHTKNWDPEEAKKLILRQHSTSTTFRYFHEKKLNHDCKYFYIADNFRNEATDATHLPEFGQAEGFIMADNLTLADLMGFVKEFYAKLGIHKIRFKPTFNPYTEPSMEAHYYNEKLGKWYALINSGIFRPEALAPYGITKSVIAWGMGSSRIAALLTGKTKLREIFGPEVDYEWIRNHKRVKTL